MAMPEPSKSGRFTVTATLASSADRTAARAGLLSPNQVRQVTVRALVDAAVPRLILPPNIANALSLRASADVLLVRADGRRCRRPLAQGVELTYMDRTSTFNAVLDPDCETAILGALVMTDLDLIADPINGTLLPRDPRGIVSEIESSGVRP